MTRKPIILNRKKIISPINGAGKIVYSHVEEETGFNLLSLTKMNLKWIRLKYRTGNLKSPRRKQGKSLLLGVLAILFWI